MSKKMKRKLIELIILVAIIILIPFFYTKYMDRKQERERNRRRAYTISDLVEYNLNSCLQDYTKDEKIIAIADTDEKMHAYKSLNEILDVATTVFNTDNCFETIVKIYTDEKYGSIVEEKEGYKYWVLIEGNYKKGYTAEVRYGEDDPFQERR